MSLCERVLKSCTSRGTAGGGASSSVPEWPSRHVWPLSSPLTCEQAAAAAKQSGSAGSSGGRALALAPVVVHTSAALSSRCAFLSVALRAKPIALLHASEAC